MPIDVIADEYVTVLDDGNLVLEDAVTGAFTHVEREKLDEFARSKPPYTAHIAKCIELTLLSATHDDCDWQFLQSARGWWYRSVARCPACGEQ